MRFYLFSSKAGIENENEYENEYDNVNVSKRNGHKEKNVNVRWNEREKKITLKNELKPNVPFLKCFVFHQPSAQHQIVTQKKKTAPRLSWNQIGQPAKAGNSSLWL